MIIQKVDIKSPNKSNNNQNFRLTKNNSTSQLINNLSNKYNLPYLSNDIKIKNESIKLSYLNSFDMRNIPKNNIKTELVLKFEPKRLIISRQKNLAKKENSFIDYRHMPLNENKAFNKPENENNINIPNLIKFSEKKSDELFDEDFLKLKNYSFRYNSLLKMEKNIKEFNNIKINNKDLITPHKLGIYDDIINKLSKIMKEQRIIFEYNLMKLDLDNNNNNTINKKKDFENFIKNEVITVCDYNNLMNKLITFLFEEIIISKDKNFKLLQKNHEEEIIINSKTKSLNELNSYINRYDVDTKINYVKIQEEKKKKMKNYYINKQNEYISKIYQLEKEIKIMANILNKNKIYFNKCKEYEDKIDINKKEIEKMKIFFRRELREKDTLVEEEMTRKNELKDELLNIKRVVDNLKKEKRHNKNADILSKTTITKLENVINERNENIMMINEELEYFIRQNFLLKKKIKEKEFTIVTLEMKIKKDKEKENILNNNTGDLSIINNLEEGQQQ